MGTVVDVNMLLLLLGASVAFVIILADTKSGAPGIFRMWLGAGSILAERKFIIFIVSLLIYPLTLLESLHQLRYTSIVGLLALLYVFLFMVVILCKQGVMLAPNGGHGGDWVYFQGGLSFWLAIPLQATSFSAQFNVMPLFEELRDPSLERMNTVIHVAMMAILGLFYTAFSVIGYLTFGSQTSDNILKNYDGSDTFCLLGQVCVAAVMALKFPLIALPFRDLFNEVALPAHFKSYMDKGKQEQKTVYALEMAVFVGIVAALVLQFDSLGKALGILGATVGSVLSFLLPGLFGYACAQSTGERVWPAAMVVFGVVTGGVGLFAVFH